MKPTEYVRITIKGAADSRAHTHWAKVISRGEEFNLYEWVDKEANDSSHMEKGVIVSTHQMVQRTTIIKEAPAVMSNHYGWLEVA